jgi:3-hydroxyisobutyrate dehydrogenase
MADVVGFIGLGAMGGGMAANVAKAGHPVVAVDPDPRARERAREHGIEVVETRARSRGGRRGRW